MQLAVLLTLPLWLPCLQVRGSIVGDRARSVFVNPPSLEELEARLRGRGTETEEKVLKRLGNAAREMEAAGEYDEVRLRGDGLRVLAAN